MTALSRPLMLAFVLTAISAVATFILLKFFGPDWTLYAPATCTATRCFCEMPRTGELILQPANSWSAFGYVFAGFLMIALSRARDWASAFPPIAASVFGISAITVGIGSVLLHGTLTLWGQFFDVLGMYLVSGFLLVSALAKWLRIPDRRAERRLMFCQSPEGLAVQRPQPGAALRGRILPGQDRPQRLGNHRAQHVGQRREIPVSR